MRIIFQKNTFYFFGKHLYHSKYLLPLSPRSLFHLRLPGCPAAQPAHPSRAPAQPAKLRAIGTRSISIRQSVKSNASFLAYETKMDNLSQKDVISHL